MGFVLDEANSSKAAVQAEPLTQAPHGGAAYRAMDYLEGEEAVSPERQKAVRPAEVKAALRSLREQVANKVKALARRAATKASLRSHTDHDQLAQIEVPVQLSDPDALRRSDRFLGSGGRHRQERGVAELRLGYGS